MNSPPPLFSCLPHRNTIARWSKFSYKGLQNSFLSDGFLGILEIVMKNSQFSLNKFGQILEYFLVAELGETTIRPGNSDVHRTLCELCLQWRRYGTNFFGGALKIGFATAVQLQYCGFKYIFRFLNHSLSRILII